MICHDRLQTDHHREHSLTGNPFVVSLFVVFFLVFWSSLYLSIERIELMAEGFYASPHGAEYQFGMATDDNSKRGDIWNYFAFGVGCAEVEVDTLTGVWRALRCDVIMDVGNSLNVALDIGQVEGAFVQGMGLCTTEELIWGDKFHPWLPQNGQLWNAGPAYKCPAPIDMPEDMRVHLLTQSTNEYAVHSSKAVGEPPTFLGGSVFFAIYDAVEACRAERGVTGGFRLDVPATFERVRMACADELTAVAVDGGGSGSEQFRAKGSH
jgi:xanthine dehydrogenase/oxidase